MQKLILDTNVIVSALISNAIPTLILIDLALAKKVKKCLYNEVFEEYVEVLSREKFARYTYFKAKANVVLSTLNKISIFYNTNLKIKVLADASDNKFLELAAASSADYLITGYVLDFKIIEFDQTEILTPIEFGIASLIHHNFPTQVQHNFLT